MIANFRKLFPSFRKISQCSRTFSNVKNDLKTEYDAIVVGAGHNGLVTAAYLQKSGKNVCVLERRHVIGGAAVTEEIVPGFKFSRASYVLSLLRPQIITDLELKKYGLKVYLRDPNSYTPLIKPGGLDGKARSLLLGRDGEENVRQIAQFSKKDAEMFVKYEHMLERIVAAIEPLLDSNPVYLPHVLASATFKEKLSQLPSLKSLLQSVPSEENDVSAFTELMTAPTTKILDKWFESEPLKATLATDSVIGAMISPKTPGSGYVLLHHVMGELEGIKGAWGYVEGGMGSVSQAIANCATDHGASVFTNKPVSSIIVENNEARGVVLEDGTEIKAKAVLSNATPKVTFLDLLPKGSLPQDVELDLRSISYESPVTKINVAVNELPNFLADPNKQKGEIMPHHRATIHLNCEHSDLIHDGYLDAQRGTFSKSPMIEMVIPSSLDPTIAPPGSHVCLLFTQYTPYELRDGQWDDATRNLYADTGKCLSDPTLAPPGSHVCLLFTQYTPYELRDGQWDDATRNLYADTVFDIIESYAPGFKDSVVGRDILTPPDIEKIFGLTGGNIFHGSMSLDQLYTSRPITKLSNYKCPIKGLYLCGSGAHPGGGVMGVPGRQAAQVALKDLK
ncbi:Pyridine nucleotide-disulfide oxidoreductase domain-containing protein 2 [Mytilus edulis]|uniref:Pyridine nucleotide-disulfide oxidoreductase domain-containing protein 2 n=1 Tax=Mytilus edulis TaxID=6550 RepID=A0A8S3PQL5_MYTED|nr:Pyridine nucleotide-disulfide oxidoreductase domain-containing protein 2 [Mytilus edulis]